MSERDEMRLPPGKTCADCAHVKRCVDFGFTKAANVRCDFHPSRFVNFLAFIEARDRALLLRIARGEAWR